MNLILFLLIIEFVKDVLCNQKPLLFHLPTNEKYVVLYYYVSGLNIVQMT